MMLGVRAVIKGDDHFSDMRPSDIQISRFHLAPLTESGVEGQQTDWDDRPIGEVLSHRQTAQHLRGPVT